MVHFCGLTRWNLIRKQENEVLLYNLSILIDELKIMVHQLFSYYLVCKSNDIQAKFQIRK